MSDAEDLLAFQLKAVGIPFEREVQFAKPRKWRADFVVTTVQPKHCLDYKGGCPVMVHAPILIEIDGGTWTSSRHTTGAGYRADLEKLNRATELGYRVLRYLPEQVESGEALAQIEKVLS